MLLQGPDIGWLRVYKLEKGTPTNQELVYSIYGPQGNEWHIVQINVIARKNKEFNILIEGTIAKGILGSTNYGDLAVDDYYFKETKCQPLGDCDFEQDTCKYTSANP